MREAPAIIYLPVSYILSRNVGYRESDNSASLMRCIYAMSSHSSLVGRPVLERAHIDADIDVKLEELDTLMAARVGSAGSFALGLAAPLPTLCESTRPGRWIDDHGNLLEVGTSSL